jgi:stage V sporulation protein K
MTAFSRGVALTQRTLLVISISLSEAALQQIHSFLNTQVQEKDENFSNGCLVRNLYDDLVMNHAKRVFCVDHEVTDRHILSLITEQDFEQISLS